MRELKRFKRGGWVLGYIPKGYGDKKHLILFQVKGLSRNTVQGLCRYCAVEETHYHPTKDDAGHRLVEEIFWDVNDGVEDYERSSFHGGLSELYHLSEDEAMMILVGDI
jgi:hypothetical protein